MTFIEKNLKVYLTEENLADAEKFAAEYNETVDEFLTRMVSFGIMSHKATREFQAENAKRRTY